MFNPAPKGGVFFMKKKCPLSLKKAFTLLELLVVTFVILILIGYFVANSSSGIEKAKIARQQFQLAKIAEAIRLFEQDWGELPPDLSLLINPVGLTQYAETKGVQTTPKSYFDAPKNHYIRLSWINESKPKTKYTDLTYFTAVSVKNSEGSLNNKHYLYDLMNADVDSALGNDRNAWQTSLQTFHRNTYALLDLWGTPVYYKPYSNGTFALFSAGPDKYAAITSFSGTFSSSETFTPDELKDPMIQKPFASPKEVLVLLDPEITEVKMDSENKYNKDNILYSPLR